MKPPPRCTISQDGVVTYAGRVLGEVFWDDDARGYGWREPDGTTSRMNVRRKRRVAAVALMARQIKRDIAETATEEAS